MEAVVPTGSFRPSVQTPISLKPSVAFAHLVDEDDVYEGYRIPGGSFIIPNAWCVLSVISTLTIPTYDYYPTYRQITHDPEIYKDPFAFNPYRFLGNNPEPDPSLIFGFGRRRVLQSQNILRNPVYLVITSCSAGPVQARESLTILCS